MEIPLDLARTLLAVVDAGTFDAAARELLVTPSAVSQRVKQLEQRLGRVLLVRAKPVRTTDAGAAVVRLARQLELLEHDALAAFGAGDAASARPTSVPLAVNADSLGTWFLPALAALAERHRVVFELHRDDQDFTAALLESGTVMGAVTSQATPVAGCLARPLGVMRYEAVATPGYVARWLPDGATPDALARAPRVDFDRRDDLQDEYLRRAGVVVEHPARHFVPASNDFATAVKLGLGWGLLPGFQSAAELERGELVRLGGEPVDVPLYWQQWNLGSPLLDAIAEGITAEARTALD
ncbi:LysR family transcriptional regulator ArgP [Agromyces tardus]|jgi:LysR family transcriptional regulator (chromosome initiation inhibitor)|uniref:LysR family transcriptional regulator ArgP n=1 Tax=Agromyces tardus TaxID=2583849 RepID=A0A3M7ZXL0_9MICO|nr:LysR family transcriptional regulator ArgP [Agromyces tardus]RNB43729.1 LysR family transcriptional regulator ArgP [Agromyces tardus]